MTLPGEVDVTLTLREDDGSFLQEWVRSEVPHLGKILDYRVDVVAGQRYDDPPVLAVTVTLQDGSWRRQLIDLDDALREVARVMLQ